MTERYIPARSPFSLPAVALSHGWIRLAPFREENSETGELSYVTRLASGQVVNLRIRPAPGGVGVEAGAQVDGAERDEVGDQVNWMLALDRDLAPFHALARREPKLAHVEEQAQGRILRSATLFEDVVKTILTTNTAWGGTVRMVEALVAQFGHPLPSDPTRRAFPTPEWVAESDEETLRSETRLGYRAPYVLELARRVASGQLDLEGLKETALPTPELRKRLLAVKGVGTYAAAHLLVLLGRYDFVPVDSWALKVVSHEWYGGEPIGKAEVEAAFEPWGEWKGLAYWFWNWDYRWDD